MKSLVVALNNNFNYKLFLEVLGVFDFILPVKCTGIDPDLKDPDLNLFNKKIKQKTCSIENLRLFNRFYVINYCYLAIFLIYRVINLFVNDKNVLKRLNDS